MTTKRSNFQRLALAAASAAAVATFGLATPAMAEQAPSSAELLQKIEELQKQVEGLKSEQQATTRQLSAAEVDAAVARVLDDAQARSEMLSMQGFTAGWDGSSFVLQNEDGSFKLNPNFQFQFRWVSNITDGDDDLIDSDISNTFDDFESDEGFEIRRMKFGVKGNAISQNLKYNFKWGTERSGGALVLEDAEIFWQFSDNWTLHVGQFKAPVHFEELTSSARQMGVDRSLINEFLGGGLTGRVQGAGLMYEQDNLRGEVVVHDGANTDNTNYSRSFGASPVSVDAPQFGVAGRVEYVAMGDGFDAANDFATIAGNATDEAFLMFGAGADFTDYGAEYAVIHTLDALYKSGQGPGTFSIFGAFYGIYTDSNEDADAIDDLDDLDDAGYNYGLELQVAYAINEKTDAFVRGSYIKVNDEAFLGDDSYYEFTVGGNYYFVDHNAKVSIDASYLPEGAPSSNSGIGVVAADGEDQIIFRGQFQLLL